MLAQKMEGLFGLHVRVTESSVGGSDVLGRGKRAGCGERRQFNMTGERQTNGVIRLLGTPTFPWFYLSECKSTKEP